MLPKKKLQQTVQEEYRSFPTYLFSKNGAENAPEFSASVSFCGLAFYSPGSFRTLKEAENAAAGVALDALSAKPDDEPRQTNGSEVPIQIQSGKVDSNLQEAANKEEMIQPPGSLPSTSESDITNMVPTSGQKEQTAPVPQIRPHSYPSPRVQFVSPRELSASGYSGRGTNKQNMRNICSTSDSENEENKEQGNNIATGMLVKRQWTEDLQQPEERISFPQFCPGDHKSQLNELAMACGFILGYSCIRSGSLFKATVNFGGQTFESPELFDKLRQAEQAAALAVLKSFSERESTLSESLIGKILLEIKAQKEGSPLPVYTTAASNESHSFTSTVRYKGMEFIGKAAKNQKKAENNAAAVAFSALKELKGSAVSTSQVSSDEGKAPVCESNVHQLIQVINHLKDETTRAGSNGKHV